MIRRLGIIAALVVLPVTILSASTAAAEQSMGGVKKTQDDAYNSNGKNIATAMCSGIKKANEEEGCSRRQDIMRLLASGSSADRSKGHACAMLYEKFANVCHWK